MKFAPPLFVALLSLAPVGAAWSQSPVPPEVVSAQIDAHFEQAWRKADVSPSPQADDAAFLRRATLDLTGIIPEVGEARRFLADARPDKRVRLVAELLERPRHATHLANVWRDVLLPRTVPESTSLGFESLLQSRFRKNVPYDALVREILLARGSLSESPSVIYYAALDTKPSELAASASRVFLGVQIRCAECHDHPFTNWTQDDFWGFAAFFARLQGPSQTGGVARLDDIASGEVSNPKTKKTVAPALFDGTAISTTTAEPRRAILARWITAKENPFFAQAAVNRAWWMMFGRGLVDPVDDLGDHHQPTHPEILNLLADDFVTHGYDLRRVFRILTMTRAYQLSSTVGAEGSQTLANYASMPVRSLSAKQVYSCLTQATGRREPLGANAARVAEQRQTLLAQLDAPTRKAIEFQGGIPQALALLNGPLVAELTDPWTSDLVAALADSPFLSDEERLETLYLATLTRLPSSEEREPTRAWIKTCRESGDGAQAFGDILWALVNSSEFLLNR